MHCQYDDLKDKTWERILRLCKEMFKRLIIAFHSRLQERTAVSYEGCFFFIGRDWYKYTWAWDVPTSVNTVLPLFLKILFHVEIRQVLTSHPVFDEENNPWSSQFCSLTRPPNLSLSVVNALLITLFFSTVTAYLLTYLLTPWCRVLLEKLTGLQLVKKFPAFHGTWRFITALTSIHHLSLSWANPIQSIYPHPTPWRSILILSTHLRLGLSSGRLPSGFPTKTLYTPLLIHTRHMPSPSHSSRFYHPHNIGWAVHSSYYPFLQHSPFERERPSFTCI